MFIPEFFDFVVAHGPACRFNQPGIHGDALVDGKAPAFKLPQDFGVDLIHGILRQSFSETGKRGMIRRGFIQRQLQELFERNSVVDLVFQLGIGLDAKPLLEHQTFKKQQRRPGIGAFTAGAHGIMA